MQGRPWTAVHSLPVVASADAAGQAYGADLHRSAAVNGFDDDADRQRVTAVSLARLLTRAIARSMVTWPPIVYR